MGEQWEGWYCVSIIFITFVALLKNVAGPDILMLGALAMMLALAAQTRTCPPAPMAYIEAWRRCCAHGRCIGQVEECLREPCNRQKMTNLPPW